jgi:hypothetical protein
VIDRVQLSTFVILLALTACAHDPVPGAVCGSKRCADGQACDLTDPAGATCVDAAADLDGDGIPNGTDLCDHAPGGRYDEDGDGIGDECDRCPIAAPPAVADADGDMVDSPCDPDPTTPGDVIIAFSGLHELPAGWTRTTPSAWQIQGGELVVTPPDPATEEVLTIPITQPSNHIAILSQWRIDAVPASATINHVAIAAIDRRPAGVAQMHCGALHDSGGDRLRLDTDASTASQTMTKLFDTGSLYRVAGKIDGASVGCALIADASQGAVQAAISPDTMSEAQLVVRGVTARFGYALVIARTTSGTP